MDEKLIQQLESAVARLVTLSTRFHAASSSGLAVDALYLVALDPSIVGYGELMNQYLARVLAVADKIEGQVLEVTKVVHEVFSVQKKLLIKVKQSQICFT